MAPIQFGILMVPYQTIDVAGPLDLLFSCSKEVMTIYESLSLPGTNGILSKSIDISFHHINETLDPVSLTAGMRALPSTTCDTCPQLDYLLVGGPDPVKFQLSPRFAEFIQTHVAAGKVLFTTCTGGLAISPSGVLDGKNATTNHGMLGVAKHIRPNVNWKKEQWVVDGNIWTAGGACAGMDMMAHWIRENYGDEVAKLGFEGLDFEPRDIEGKRIFPAKAAATA